MRAGWLVLQLVAAVLVPLAAPAVPATAQTPAATTGTPATPVAGVRGVEPVVLVHFYIWFTRASWDRAKIDFPASGHYSSDDGDVMRQQVRQAKAAGIDGFIVSWKSSPDLDRRLATLVQVATEEHFKLALTYQGLDFNRTPLPAPRIAADLASFVGAYADNPVFDIFGKPLVVLTGTSVMLPKDIAALTAPLRPRVLVLASDKNVASYERIAAAVDGDLYYWSSVNPETHGQYIEKLRAFGAAVRAHGGLWVAPVAPGFDARLVGGTSTVARRDGATLREEWAAAVSSGPDALGVISWNEFSENTHIEPSRTYGEQYLRVLATLTGAGPTDQTDGDSSGPAGQGGLLRPVLALGGLAGLFVVSLVLLFRRRTPQHPRAAS